MPKTPDSVLQTSAREIIKPIIFKQQDKKEKPEHKKETSAITITDAAKNDNNAVTVDGLFKKKKKKPLPFQHCEYGPKPRPIKPKPTQPLSHSMFAVDSTNNRKRSGSPAAGVFPSPHTFKPTRFSAASLKKLHLYKVKPLPEPNSYARAQQYHETRAAVDRVFNAAEDLIPAVGPLGEGYKGRSPPRRVNFPSARLSDNSGDPPVTPGGSADYELTEEPQVYHYKLPRMIKVGEDRLAVGYTSDEKGNKIRTISVLEPIKQLPDHEKPIITDQSIVGKNRSRSGIGSVNRADNNFSNLE